MVHLLAIEERWEHFFSRLGQLAVGLLNVWLLYLGDFAILVNYEHQPCRHSDILITHSVCLTITKTAEERWLI